MKWNATRNELVIAHEISLRAKVLAGFDIAETSMDVIAVHLNGCSLRLEALLEARPGDFMHDVSGIRRHLNRRTGKLGDCFLPRFSV